MPSKPRRIWLPALAWLLPMLLAAARAGAGDPAAQAMRDMQGDIAARTQQQMMMSSMYFGETGGGKAMLPAYFRIFTARGMVEGMGAWYAWGEKAGGKPKQSWIELAGARYFPEETDSIRVWDLSAYPKEGNWVFVMARGAIEAYAFNPLDGAQYYARPGQDTARGDESKWRPVDSFWRDWHWNRIVEARNGDATMAIRLANAAEGERLLEWVARLDEACKGKRFAEADSLIAKASGISPDYPRLQLRIGNCMESQGRPGPAIAAFRKALRYAGMDEDLRKDAEDKVREMEAKPGH